MGEAEAAIAATVTEADPDHPAEGAGGTTPAGPTTGEVRGLV